MSKIRDRFFSSIQIHLRQYKLLRQMIRPIAQLPKIRNIESLYKRYPLNFLDQSTSRSLDLGCGLNPRNPFNASQLSGVDICHISDLRVKSGDLAIDPIPFQDNYFDYVTAYDFIEHIPRVIYNPHCRFAFVLLMNEIFRVLKFRGIFFSHTPLYPFGVSMSDPTHVNYITAETFPDYFCGVDCLGRAYGFNGSFDLLEQARLGTHLITVLRKSSF